jgi:hypothetical protein
MRRVQDRSRQVEVGLHETEVATLECPDKHGHPVAPDVDVRRVAVGHEPADVVAEPRRQRERVGGEERLSALGQHAPCLGARRRVELSREDIVAHTGLLKGIAPTGAGHRTDGRTHLIR